MPNDAILMRTLSPMTSIGRRGSGSTVASDTGSELGSVHSARRLIVTNPVPSRSASPLLGMNLSDVWVPPDIQRVGTPSGSPLVVVPTPEILVLNEIPEPTHVKEVSRWRSVAANVVGGVLTLGAIAGFFYGMYAWIKHNKTNN